MLLRFRPEAYQVETDRGKFDLTRQQAAIVAALVRAKGATVPIERLLHLIGHEYNRRGGAVPTVMAKLRKKGIDVDAVYGVGYRLRSRGATCADAPPLKHQLIGRQSLKSFPDKLIGVPAGGIENRRPFFSAVGE